MEGIIPNINITGKESPVTLAIKENRNFWQIPLDRSRSGFPCFHGLHGLVVGKYHHNCHRNFKPIRSLYHITVYNSSGI